MKTPYSFATICALILSILMPALPGAVTARAESHYLKYVEWGDQAIAKGKYADAIECFREAMRAEPSNPQNVMLLSNVGMLQHYQGQDSLALHTLSEARAIAPGSVVILMNRARILQSLNRLEDAMADYNKVIEMDSTYAEAYYDRSALYLTEKKMAEAEADATKYLHLQPTNLQGKLLMAVIYTNTARPADAIPLYTELIKAKPEAAYYSARAMCRLALDQLAEASDDIALGLELNPNDGELYFCRAVLNIKRFREEDAKVDAAKAQELGVNPIRVKALFLEPKE